MFSEWSLEALGKIVTGKTPPKSFKNAYSDSGVPFVTPKDMDGRKWTVTTERSLSHEGVRSVQKSVVPAGSVAVSCIGSDMGKAVRIPVDSVTNQQINTLIPDTEKCDPDYLYYLLSTMQQDLKDIAGGSATPILNKGHFGKVRVRLPAIWYQKQAAKILSALDDKIQVNHQINQTLEQMAQAIFKSWFVDFEPVKAKIAALEAGGSEEDALLAAMQTISGKDETELARFQAEQPEQYAELRATAELFPSAMQDSELGEIPEGWSVSPISDFGRIVCGKTPSKQKSEFYGGHIPFIKIPDMHGNMFVTTTSDHLSPVGAASQPKKAIPKGSVCVSCIATVGQVVIATKESHTNQQINSIIPFEDNYTAYLYFRMESLYEHLHDLASGGSATLNLNTGNFSRVQILMPSDSILAGYAKSCTALLDRILCNMKESQSLSTLRDTLLPKLLSGELSVSDTEDQLAKVAEPASV